MSRIVIDASVAVAWCFPDESSDFADAVLAEVEHREVIVPTLWSVEVSNALLVGERRKRIRETEIWQFVQLLDRLAIFEDSQPTAEVMARILPLARAHNLSAYDAAYLDVAVRHRAPLATLDSALLRAAIANGVKHFRA